MQLGVGDPAIVLLKQETSLDKDQKFPGRMQKILWGWVVMEQKPHISFFKAYVFKNILHRNIYSLNPLYMYILFSLLF